MDFSEFTSKFLSFASIGGILTILSLGLNTLFLKGFNTHLQLTYIMVNSFVIMLSYILNSKYTFKNEINLKNTAKYYIIYGSSLAIGASIISILDKNLTYEKWVYPFMALPVTLTFNFFVSSRFLSPKKATPN